MAFNPASDLTGLIGWWDASVTASLTLSGSNVTSFADQSGGGNTISGHGLGRAMPYSATGFNTSYPGITTVSGNGFLETDSAFPMGTGNTLTAWYVGTLGTGGSRIMSYCASGGNDFNRANSWTIANASPFDNVAITRNSVAVGPSSGLTTNPAGHRVICTITSSGLMTTYVDGVVGGTPATSAGNWANNGSFDLFRQASHDDSFWYGTIAEAGVATGFSDATTVAALDTYLGIKWGLILSRKRHNRDGGVWMQRGGVWRRVVPRRLIMPDDVRKRSPTRLLRAA